MDVPEPLQVRVTQSPGEPGDQGKAAGGDGCKQEQRRPERLLDAKSQKPSTDQEKEEQEKRLSLQRPTVSAELARLQNNRGHVFQ
jgi:hypothetical protein